LDNKRRYGTVICTEENLFAVQLPVPVTAPVLGSNSDIVHASSEHVPVLQLLSNCYRIIQVHRLNIKKDLIDLFRDPLIMSQDIKILNCY